MSIYEYVSHDSDVYADRLMDRLTRRSQQIGTFPRSGRSVPEYEAPDVREVIEGSYRIIYRIGEEQIDVLAVVHSAQELPPEPDQPYRCVYPRAAGDEVAPHLIVEVASQPIIVL